MSWLRRQARARPEATALRVPAADGQGLDPAPGLRLDWRALNGLVERAAGVLGKAFAEAGPAAARGSGAAAGRPLAVALGNTVEHVVSIHAAERLGAVLVPLDPRLDRQELRRRLEVVGERLGPPVLVSSEKDLGGGSLPAAVRVVAPEELLAGDAAAASPEPRELGAEPPEPAPGLSDDRLHSILFTSGSTGRPEPVELTRGNHLASAVASAFNLGVERGDDWLCCLPLCHVGGLAIVLRSVLYGTSVTLLERFDAAAVAKLLAGPPEGRPITLASLVPTMLGRLLAELPDLPPAGGAAPPPFPGLRAVLLGGGPVTPELVARAVERGVPALATYGMTETASQVATVPPERFPGGILERPGSAGVTLFGAEIEIRRRAAGSDRAPDRGGEANGVREQEAAGAEPGLAEVGEVGEIFVRGPMVSAAAAEASGSGGSGEPAGWLRTGDLGRFDEHGDLWVVGRADQVIVTGGENVSPERVEAVLGAHPEVAECAVVGVDDPEWGRAVAAAAVPADPAAPPDPEDLAAWCRERLAPYEVPKRWHLLPELPRTAAGKVARDELSRRLASG